MVHEIEYDVVTRDLGEGRPVDVGCICPVQQRDEYARDVIPELVVRENVEIRNDLVDVILDPSAGILFVHVFRPTLLLHRSYDFWIGQQRFPH
jgi:hypothetical protein